MNIAITGASGFIGTHLSATLLQAGHSVRPLGRSPQPSDLLAADAIVHLAGEPVGQRWTPAVKERIYTSRVDGTRSLIHALTLPSKRPQVLVCASAVGFYGSRGDEILTEHSPPALDFLANVVVDWEATAREAEPLGIRVVNARSGIVLGHGGALARMLPPFRFGVGGRLGSGRQWMSWIHLDDAVRLIQFAIENDQVSGPVNITAPNPVTNAEFTRELAKTLHRPAIFPVPGFALRLMFGEMADTILASQRVLPAAAQSAGFEFRYGTLAPALADLLSK